METVVKAFLQKADSSVEVRRFSLTVQDKTTFVGAFKDLERNLKQCFSDLKEKMVTLAWKDSDGDYIVMSTDQELMEAVSQCKGSVVKIYITVDGDMNQMPENDDDFFTVLNPSDVCIEEKQAMDDENSKEATKAVNTSGEGSDDDIIFMGDGHGMAQCPPGPIPPFPGFGFVPPPPPPPPFPPMEFWKQGFHGRGRHGLRGGAFKEAFGGFGKAWRKHAAMFGPALPFDPMGPFAGCPRRGQRCERNAERGAYNDNKRKAGQKLRELVPVNHRRWAKSYIREWRSSNLKNATTTTSGDEKQQQSEGQSMENVPEVYAKWLDGMLPKWHKRWGADKPDDEEFNPADITEFEKIKASVPWEFRKWVKWYLNRHFAPKEAPQLRGAHDRKWSRMAGAESNQHSAQAAFSPCHMKKQWKESSKILKKSVHPAQRRWAKGFIRQWRLERNLAGIDGEGSSSNTESDGAVAKKASQEEHNVHEDYAKWLRMLLVKIHAFRGFIVASDEEKSVQLRNMYLDTVPMNFRQWVRNFIKRSFERSGVKKHDHHRHHNGHHGRPFRHGRRFQNCEVRYATASVPPTIDDEEAVQMSDNPRPEDVEKYQQMLKTFQKQWLKEQQEGTSSASDGDFIVLSDESDEEDDELIDRERVVSSFKRLRVDGADETKNKEVRFEESGRDTTHPVMNIRSSRRTVKGDGRGANVPPEFRRWARDALLQWDGKTVSGGTDATKENGGQTVGNDNEQTIPPRLYNWMAKQVLKRQKKQMKQEMKEAKRMMKHARKAQRHNWEN